LLEARRTEPGEDLLSGLIAVRDAEEGRLNEDEVVGMVVVLVGAGYVSTRNAIAVGAVHLTSRLDTVDGPVVDEQVVEEALPEEVPWTHGHVDSGPSALPVTW
jgi:cytochrome P450